ncbi:hypothetical protein TKK_0005216 [Trichogramma kaykai]
MMESREDAVRVKEEPSGTWSDTGEDNNYDSVDNRDVKNFGTMSFRKQLTSYVKEEIGSFKNLDENLSILSARMLNLNPSLC